MNSIEKCKIAKKTGKQLVTMSKGRVYEDIYRHLSMKQGDNDIYIYI
jgi:hypothetical protein